MSCKSMIQYTLSTSDSFKSDLHSTRTEFRERLICNAFPIKKSSPKSNYISRIFA